MPWESLVWVVPLGVGIAGILRPSWGICLFAASLPFFGSPPGGPYLSALDASALAVIATSLRAPSPQRSVFTVPVLALVLIGMASLLPLLYNPPSWHPRQLLQLASVLPGVESWSALYTWRAALDLLLGVGIFHAVRRSVWREGHAPLGVAVAIGLGAASILGLLEHLEIADLSRYRAVGQYVAPERMHSVFFNSGWFAEYLVVGAPFAVASLLVLGWRISAATLAALSLTCILLTQQRGAWVACLFQLGLLAVAAGRRLTQKGSFRRRLALTASVALALVSTVVVLSPTPRTDALRSRFVRPFSDLAGREGLWLASLEMAPQRPLLGWGAGSFAPVYDSFYPPGSAKSQRPRATAHNWYLNVLVESGILGLAALALLAAAAVTAARRWWRSSKPERRTLGVGLSVSLAGALVYGLVQYMPFLRSVHWLLWILLACLACGPPAASRRWVRTTALAIVTIGLVWLPFRWWLPQRDVRGDRAYGFRELSLSGPRPYQWAGPLAATRVPWAADCLRVPMANGHPFPQHEVEVDIRAADARRLVRPGRVWSEEILEVGRPRATSFVVELRTTPSFRPFQDLLTHGVSTSRDVRLLGVAVGDIEAVPCSSVLGGLPVEDQ